MKRLAAFAVVLLVIVLTGAAWVVHALRTPTTSTLGASLPRQDLPRAPDGVRIRVQVLNTTGRHGLARRATRMLRDSSRYLDVTVLLGRSWSPPPEPFNP